MLESKKKKKRSDVNVLAKDTVDEATDEEPAKESEEEQVDPGKDPKAVKAGRLGGLKGGTARAQKLSAEERSEIARKAALARWRRSK